MKTIKILVVDDEVLIGMLLKRGLSSRGHQVLGPVTSGSEAIQVARAERPDVVVMDIRLMGEMDGIDAASQILSFYSPAFIFATGYHDPAVRNRAMALRPLAYLMKPISWQDIDVEICGWLGQAPA